MPVARTALCFVEACLQAIGGRSFGGAACVGMRWRVLPQRLQPLTRRGPFGQPTDFSRLPSVT